MNLLRDNTARAKLIISVFWIMLGLAVVDMGTLVWQYSLMSAAQSDVESADMKMIDASDTVRSFLVIVRFIMYVLTAIVFIMWFRRAYYNLNSLPWNNARYTEGWAAGSWFVPIIWFWWPFQIMMDIWRGTQNVLRERLGEPQPGMIVGWWWALFLLSRIYGFFIRAFYREVDGIDSFITAVKMQFVGEIITIAALVIAIIMIQRTNFFERELLAHAETPNDSIFSDNYIPPEESTEPKIENLNPQ
jgi:hypothetical protein